MMRRFAVLARRKTQVTYRSGFTLLEVLLVIALIGLLTAALVVGGAALLRQKEPSPEEIFWRAVGEARDFALIHQVEVRLAFDPEEKTFHARTPEGSESFAVPFEGDLRIEFLSAQPTGRSVLIGGVLVETQPLESVTFFEDGTCTPFRAQLRVGSGEPQVIEIDPWTCAPMLREEEANG